MAKRGYKLQEFVAHASHVNCLNIGKKSSRLLLTGGNDRKVNLWAVGKTTPLLCLSGHATPVESVTFDSTEGLVLAGAKSGAIKLWDLEEAKVVRTLTGHRSKCASLEFHPFGEFFASGSLDADLKIWDIRKKGCSHTYKGHSRGIRTVRFTPDGRWVVSGGEDNIVKVWDLTAGKLLHDFNFHNGVIRSIDFHPHEFLLATGSADQTVKFWDLETFELIGSAGPEGAGVRSMIFHPDGKTLFCALDESLKILSWEPVRYHDDVDIGWSTLGDLSIYEGKLLGCSYHQSSVGIWVADISLIGPYAGDAIYWSNDTIESVIEPVAKQRKESVKSFSVDMNKPTDQGSVVKEIIQAENVTSNDGYQRSLGKVGPVKVSKTNSSLTALLRGKDKLSLSETQTFEEDLGERSSTSKRSLRETQSMKSRRPIQSERNSLSKGNLMNSSRDSGSGLLNLKKKSTVKVCAETGTNSSSANVCTPFVKDRDDIEVQNRVNCQNDTCTSKFGMEGTVLDKPTHLRISSYGGDHCKSWLNATKPLSDIDEVVDSNLLQKFMANSGIKDADGKDQANNRPLAENFERVVFLDRSFGSFKEKSLETQDGSFAGPDTHSSGSEIRPVKYVNGVAIQHGRTRSLVESWEKKDKFNNRFTTESSFPSDTTTQTDNVPLNKLSYEQEHQIGRGAKSEDDGLSVFIAKNRDFFVNILKSRLTKLQMVRHCWEKNGIKDTINAIAKLRDPCVQVDVISTLVEKVDLFNLDLFSCLLPLLVGLVGGKSERHIDISMEMLLKLVRIFGPVIHSTLSASSPVGIDIEAEKRRKLCGQCFKLLEQLKEMLPPLIRRGGSLGRHAMELNLALQQ